MNDPDLASLSEVASLINAGSGLDQTLRQLLAGFCHNSRWVTAVIMSVDVEAGFVDVIARYSKNEASPVEEKRWALADSPARVALETGAPVIIPDAQTAPEFPGYQRLAIETGLHTVVVLPTGFVSRAGYSTVLAASSTERLTIEDSEIALLRFIVHLGTLAIEKADALAAEQAFAQQLRAAISGNAGLLACVLDGGSVARVAAEVASMLPSPLVIVDLTSRDVLAIGSPAPDLLSGEEWAKAVRTDLAGRFLDLARDARADSEPQSRHLSLPLAGRSFAARAIVRTLVVDDERVGALIVFSPNGELADFDHLLLDSACFGLSVQMMRSHVRFTTEARNFEDLFADLIDGTSRPAAELVSRAARIGIDLGEPAHILIATMPTGSELPEAEATETLRIVSELARRFDPAAVVFRRMELVAVRYAAAERSRARTSALAARIVEELGRLAGTTPVATITRVCNGAEDYAKAWREAGRVLDLARRFGRSGLLAARDFGPFPVLLSAVGEVELRDFVDGSIGAVAAHDRAHGTEYVRTLSAYLDHGCRSQATADHLAIHVTTLRYRIARLEELFGLQLETPEQRFGLQLALQVRAVTTDPFD